MTEYSEVLSANLELYVESVVTVSYESVSILHHTIITDIGMNSGDNFFKSKTEIDCSLPWFSSLPPIKCKDGSLILSALIKQKVEAIFMA
jgi:hypothetical protein